MASSNGVHSDVSLSHVERGDQREPKVSDQPMIGAHDPVADARATEKYFRRTKAELVQDAEDYSRGIDPADAGFDCDIPMTFEDLAVLTSYEEKSVETICQEADRIINGPRAAYYGPPSENFQRIADLWSGYVSAKTVGLPDGSEWSFSAQDVAMMMILMKIARLQNTYHRDSVVDIAGYAGCMEKMEDGQ